MSPTRNWRCFPWRDAIQRDVRWLFCGPSESSAAWTVPWGSLHLLWLHTTSAGQTLRASWSGPALSSAADGPESWRRHQLQLRSRAQSNLPAVSPSKTKQPQKHHVNTGISFRGPIGGTRMGWDDIQGQADTLNFISACVFLLYNPVSWIRVAILYIRSLDLIRCSTFLLKVLAD